MEKHFQRINVSSSRILFQLFHLQKESGREYKFMCVKSLNDVSFEIKNKYN